MVKIVLKPKFKKLRDEARKKVSELQEARREAAGPKRTSATIKKVKDLEQEVAQIVGRTNWADSKDVEEHRLSAWVGDEKPYELAGEGGSPTASAHADAALKAAQQALDEDFYKVASWPDAKLKFAYLALGGKEQSVARAAAVELVENALDGMSLTD